MEYLKEHFWNEETKCIDGSALWTALQPYITKGELVVNVGKEDRTGLVLVTYSKTYQYEHNKVDWDPLVKQCRGIIFDTTDNYKIVALPFPKFFNYGEGGIHYPSQGAKLEGVYEKVDGCCDANTIITTEDGEKTIKEIVDSSYKGKILSFNIESQQPEMKKVISHSVMNNNNDWYDIELDNGSIIKLTGNHKVWIPKIHAYRKVENLIGNEEFLLKD